MEVQDVQPERKGEEDVGAIGARVLCVGAARQALGSNASAPEKGD